MTSTIIGAKNEVVGGRYRLLDVVGSGGAGVVWRAYDSELSRDVAIKLLSSDVQDYKARIWREARLAALLSTVGAVPVYDFGDDGDHCFLVMELIDTPTLRKLLEIDEFQPLALPDLLNIGCSLLRVLKSAHKLNVVHRDIKPENIFVFGQLGRELSIQLVDFGLAFLGDTSRAGLGRLSDAQSISGTPAYLSPEQARGDTIDIPTDIYSAGCVLYEMCSGDAPFTGPIAEVLGKHIYVPPIPVHERNRSIPPDLSHLLDQMMAKSPSDRPKADQVLLALESLIRSSVSGQPSNRRSSGGLARSQRMLAATAPQRNSIANLCIGFIGKVPDRFVDQMKHAGLQVTQDLSKAKIIFAHPDLPASDFPRNRCVVAWLQNEEKGNLSLLIRKGFRDVFSNATSTDAIVRRLSRLVRIPETSQKVTTV